MPGEDDIDPTGIDRFVGSKLRAVRKARGQNQGEIGALIGVTYQQIQKYETGANRISAGTLWALCQKLQMPVGYFFPRQDGSVPPDPFDSIRDERVRALARSLVRVLGQSSYDARRDP